jgi:hypothetical protein
MPGYNNNIPQPSDQINDSQPLILQNFATIDSEWQINHVDFTDGTNHGKHKFVQMPEQGADAATAVNEGAIYTKEGATSGVTELCFRRESNGDVIEITAGEAAAVGWTRLPSGILMKWGVDNHNLGNPQAHTYNFPGGAPAFNNVYSCSLTTIKQPADNVHGFLQTLTAANFTWYAEQRLSNNAPLVAFSVYYIVIGD